MRGEVEKQFDKLEGSVRSAFLDIVKDTLSKVLQEYPPGNLTTSIHDSPHELAESGSNIPFTPTICNEPTSFDGTPFPLDTDYGFWTNYGDFTSESLNSYPYTVSENPEQWFIGTGYVGDTNSELVDIIAGIL